MCMCIFVCVFLVALVSTHQSCNAHIFTSQLHHPFSQSLQSLWTHHLPPPPPKGTLHYYSLLATRDRFLHARRRLSHDDSPPLTLSDGNSTFRISSLGFLHYTVVSLGTPAMKFMVALDTGSDLFWVPCDCNQCASIDDTPDSSSFELSIYSPKRSSTSKKVTCNNSLCTPVYSCPETFSHCPYSVSYVSSETSTSGILVEDVLHLKTEDSKQETVETYVTFGCGQVQTGSFLDVAAPDGLFGLGFENISVPSLLSQEGYTANSFSMCFGEDGTGRISFGDKGTIDQEETPFNVDKLHPTYNITLTQIRVGTALIDLNIAALFDSGTSFTYLVGPSYKRLSESFHLQTQDKRYPPDPRIPFDYCYYMSPGVNTSLIPTMTLTMKGGGQLTVSDPIVVISTKSELVYCLAVIGSAELNIIGQNFMTGHRIVFDREKLVLGWKKSDCHYVEDSSSSQFIPRNSTSVPPAVAVGLGNHSTPKSSEIIDRDRSSVASPIYGRYAYDLTDISSRIFFLLFLLF